ncbi:IPExxxVDY family protein [Spongiimicrobium salis]|uniref:IPExxxVDY family protein n=1 Tax=Spongiimicrobium salis TaxID=1667022 RepID=UPI00374DF59A
MTAIHRISDDFYEDSFALIAIHSSLEDYAIAYALNERLKSKLRRSRNDLDISENRSFPIFEWKDVVNDAYWTLIINNSIKKAHTDEVSLFKEELSYTRHHLVPEYKEVDYFLKIERDELDFGQDIVKLILTIPQVITAYMVESNKLKSKNNLIF